MKMILNWLLHLPYPRHGACVYHNNWSTVPAVSLFCKDVSASASDSPALYTLFTSPILWSAGEVIQLLCIENEPITSKIVKLQIASSEVQNTKYYHVE